MSGAAMLVINENLEGIKFAQSERSLEKGGGPPHGKTPHRFTHPPNFPPGRL